MIDKPPGIYPGMSRAEYYQIDALNISLLIEGERSMDHLKYAMENRKDSTDAMDRGTALHLAVFEPSEFEKKVTFYPHPSSKGKVRNGSEWEHFKESRDEDLILRPVDFQKVISMRDALKRHARARELLESRGTGEMAAIWKDKNTGLLCKGLLDRFCSCWGYTCLPDLKSTTDARPIEFAKTVYNLHYHTKAAWYLDGLASIADVPRRFLWIAIESQPPHGIMIYDPSDAMIQKGRQNYRSLLTRFAECKSSGIWPGYPLGEESIELPKWGA
jgi:exodeoxyribonuclease VIII